MAAFRPRVRRTPARAAAAACPGLPAWARTPMPKRGEILAESGRSSSRQRLDEVAESLTREEGKTLAEEQGRDRARREPAALLRGGGDRSPRARSIRSASASTFLYAERVPSGPVALITPWNFPIAIPAWKVAPALAFGNTVVFKPAELTPVTAWHLVDVLEKAGVPPGVLNLVVGRGSQVGQALVADPRIKAISFTGSERRRARARRAVPRSGARVPARDGGARTRWSCWPTRTLEKATEITIAGAMLSTGQKCTATSRVIVEKPVADRFRDGPGGPGRRR